MAQVVGYFEDFASPRRRHEAYSEGPFVMVYANGWRIEAEIKGGVCPCMPDLSVYELRRRAGFKDGKFNDPKEAAALCDWLNQQVRKKQIIRHGARWIAPEFSTDNR